MHLKNKVVSVDFRNVCLFFVNSLKKKLSNSLIFLLVLKISGWIKLEVEMLCCRFEVTFLAGVYILQFCIKKNYVDNFQNEINRNKNSIQKNSIYCYMCKKIFFFSSVTSEYGRTIINVLETRNIGIIDKLV